MNRFIVFVAVAALCAGANASLTSEQVAQKTVNAIAGHFDIEHKSNDLSKGNDYEEIVLLKQKLGDEFGSDFYFALHGAATKDDEAYERIYHKDANGEHNVSKNDVQAYLERNLFAPCKDYVAATKPSVAEAEQKSAALQAEGKYRHAPEFTDLARVHACELVLSSQKHVVKSFYAIAKSMVVSN